MKRFQIEISEGAFDTLCDIADRERRPPRDQAGWMLEQALRAQLVIDQATADSALMEGTRQAIATSEGAALGIPLADLRAKAREGQ